MRVAGIRRPEPVPWHNEDPKGDGVLGLDCGHRDPKEGVIPHIKTAASLSLGMVMPGDPDVYSICLFHIDSG